MDTGDLIGGAPEMREMPQMDEQMPEAPEMGEQPEMPMEMGEQPEMPMQEEAPEGMMS
jgi:hypothetical protein